MSQKLSSLIYCSRNNIRGDLATVNAQLKSILAAARTRNRAAGVTGALLYSSARFAQVLEGPSHAVESTFERIQRDARHGDVVVLRMSPIQARQFPEWSMALAVPSPAQESLVTKAFLSSAENQAGTGMEILRLLRDLTTQKTVETHSLA